MADPVFPSSPPPRAKLPPGYLRRMVQGIAAWLLFLACVGGALAFRAEATLHDIDSRTPQAAARIKTVFLTPQISDDTDIIFETGGVMPGKGAYVALIITELGLSEADSVRAVEDMPPEITLAFSPYGPLEEWIKKARAYGHEVLALLPMEPGNYPRSDPGPTALLTRVSEKDNASDLASVLRRSNGATGVMNFMGEAFMRNATALDPVFVTLKKAGASFVEAGRAESRVAEDMAKAVELPYLAADIRIDAEATETAVAQRLVDLEKMARSKGSAVGIAGPYPVTFNTIKSWHDGLEERGVKLIPVSAMIKVRTHATE